MDVECSMLRGILLPPGIAAEQRASFEDLLKRVPETPTDERRRFGGRSPRAAGG